MVNQKVNWPVLNPQGQYSTPSQLLICSSFSRTNGHPLLICSSPSAPVSKQTSPIDCLGRGMTDIFHHFFEHRGHWFVSATPGQNCFGGLSSVVKSLVQISSSLLMLWMYIEGRVCTKMMPPTWIKDIYKPYKMGPYYQL